MPIYEYLCPQCENKFEEIRTVARGRFARCPNCNRKSYKIPSVFSFFFFNPLTVDGEGFTSKYVKPEELAEMNQECRER